MSRHYGINVRADLSGGIKHPPARLRANTTPRDSKPPGFFDDDADFAALIFALGCLMSPFVIGGICLVVISYFA